MADRTSAELGPGDRLGDYEIQARVAEGDTGEVYRAASIRDEQLVALKVVRAGIFPDEVIARFIRESKLAQRVRHEHLVEVIDAGRAGDRLYMAMAYIRAQTLAQLIGGRGRLDVDDIVRMVSEVGAALDAVHHAGIVHRDVRTSNILVRDDGAAFLTDFSFAKATDDTRITDIHQRVGTLDYRAPELFLGGEATPQSDLYALGCVTFECLTGAPPFADRAAFRDLGRAHLDEEPPDAVAVRSDVSRSFFNVALLALSKDPVERPPTATAYARLLRFSLRSPS